MEEHTIDLREILHIIKKKYKQIVKITGAFIVLAILYLLIASPVYESEALLRIKQPKGLGSSLLEAVPGGNAMSTKQLMSTYAEILKSRSVVVPVIEATEEANKDGKYPGYEGYVKGRITTVPFKDTEILKVTVNAKDPEKARAANELLLETFLNRLTEINRSEQRMTKEFLGKRLDTAKTELDEAEAALQKFKAQHNIINPTAQATAIGDRVMLVDKVAAENQLNVATAQARLSEINGQLGGAARNTADNDVIRGLNTKLAELEVAKVGYLEKYTEKHPRLKETDAEIAGLKGQMQQEFNRIAALQAPSSNIVHQGLIAAKFQSEAEISIAQAKAEALKNIEKENNEAIKKLTDKEQAYLRVARDAEISREIYTMLAKRLEEAKVAEVMVANEVQPVDPPTLPERPVKPRKALTVVLAGILGLMAATMGTVAYEMMHRKIRTEDDVRNYLGLPIIGLIPDADSMHKAAADKNKVHSILERIGRFFVK